jgi:hypothetical protein
MQRIGRLAALVGAVPSVEGGTTRLSPGRRRMLDSIPDDCSRRARRACLGGFARFCAARGIEPELVTKVHMQAYHAWRAEHSLLKNVAQHINAARRAFNIAAEQNQGAGIARLVAAQDPRIRALPVNAFPASFGADLEAYLNRLSNRGPFND